MGDMADYYGYCDPEPDLVREMEEINRKASKRLDWTGLWDDLRDELKN